LWAVQEPQQPAAFALQSAQAVLAPAFAHLAHGFMALVAFVWQSLQATLAPAFAHLSHGFTALAAFAWQFLHAALAPAFAHLSHGFAALALQFAQAALAPAFAHLSHALTALSAHLQGLHLHGLHAHAAADMATVFSAQQSFAVVVLVPFAVAIPTEVSATRPTHIAKNNFFIGLNLVALNADIYIKSRLDSERQ
jgi:hypothetical protein